LQEGATRNISFALTTDQFLDGSKNVTRRIGWEFLKAGDVLCAVKQSQGLKKGEKVVRLGQIRVVNARFERLGAISLDDVGREGFYGRTPGWFVDFFCKANRCDPDTVVTRIEFERLQP
jgi:hypothetical protein